MEGKGSGIVKMKMPKARPRPVGTTVLIAVGMGICAMLLGAVITAALVAGGRLDESSVAAASIVSMAIAAFLTAIFSMAGEGANAAISFAAACGIVYLVPVGLNIALFGCNFSRFGSCTLVFLLGIAGAFAVKIIRGKAGAKRKIKYRFR